MIRKVTIINDKALSWELIDSKPKNILKPASETLREHGVFYHKAASLISFLEQFPEASIEQAIGAHFGPKSYSVSVKTKKKRTWFVYGGLYIHEEI